MNDSSISAPKNKLPSSQQNLKFPWDKPSANDSISGLSTGLSSISGRLSESNYFPKMNLKLSPPEKRTDIKGISEKDGCNYISSLKEYSDQAHVDVKYEFIPQNGFICVCHVKEVEKGQGQGGNKQEAKKEATKQAILRLLKEDKKTFDFFSRFLNIEYSDQGKLGASSTSKPEEKKSNSKNNEFNNPNVNLGENDEIDAVICLNQYCQQKFKTNLQATYEYSARGFKAIIKVDKYEQEAEGPSKKIARQNAAKLLCERLNINFSPNNLFEELAIICQKNCKQTPFYKQLDNLPNNNYFQVQVTCGDFIEIGVGLFPKDAKLQAAQQMLKKFKSEDDNNKTQDDVLDFLNDLHIKDISRIDYFNEVLDESEEITTNKLNNFQSKFKEFKNYMEEKLISENMDSILSINSETNLLRDFDKAHLMPKTEDLRSLNEKFNKLMTEWNKEKFQMKVDHFIPVGSYLTNSLRKYKFEIDILAFYDSKVNSSKSIAPSLMDRNKEILEKMKEFIFEKRPELGEPNSLSILPNKRGEIFLNIRRMEEFSKFEVFHSMRIFPCQTNQNEKYSLLMKCNKIMMEKRESLSNVNLQNLFILLRVLKFLKDNYFKEMGGDIVEIITFAVTKSFSDIDLIPNLRRFMQVVAFGGLTTNLKNLGLWKQIPECFCKYIAKEINDELGVKIEKKALDIMKKGFDEILKHFQ